MEEEYYYLDMKLSFYKKEKSDTCDCNLNLNFKQYIIPSPLFYNRSNNSTLNY